jgi:D-alanyl-D-alanine carboxypeptidase
MMRFQIPRFMTPFSPLPPVIGHSGAVGSWLFYCPSLDMFFTGTVSQVTAAAAPFRVIPKLLHNMEKQQLIWRKSNNQQGDRKQLKY